MKIDILTFDAASGHKSAAEAIRCQLSKQMPAAEIRVIDLEDVLKCQTRLLDNIYRFGINYFNWCMRKESYLLFPFSIKAWIRFARINTGVRSLKFLLRWTSQFWNDRTPDAIVSVTPMLHTVVFESARIVNPEVNCITVPVDYCEMTPGYWFQPKVQQQYLLGCDRLFEDAKAEQVPQEQLQRISGMVADPRFYDTKPINRESFLTENRLDPNLPMGVISFGGQGTVNVLRCAKRIIAAKLPVNLICLTGRNQELKSQVENLDSPHPIVAREFTPEPPVDILRAADFLIGKPGTMTLTEALVTETPFVFVKSTGLDIVQRANEEWVLEKGIGVQADTPDAVDECVRQVLSNKKMLEQIRETKHDGIFDAVQAIKAHLASPAQESESTKESSQRKSKAA